MEITYLPEVKKKIVIDDTSVDEIHSFDSFEEAKEYFMTECEIKINLNLLLTAEDQKLYLDLGEDDEEDWLDLWEEEVDDLLYDNHIFVYSDRRTDPSGVYYTIEGYPEYIIRFMDEYTDHFDENGFANDGSKGEALAHDKEELIRKIDALFRGPISFFENKQINEDGFFNSSFLKKDIVSLRKEINELEDNLKQISYKKWDSIRDLVNSNTEYQDLDKQINQLEDRIKELENQYGRWETYTKWVRYGEDDYDREYEDYFEVDDEEKAKELQPQVDGLKKEVENIRNKSRELYHQIENNWKKEQDLENKQKTLKDKKELYNTNLTNLLDEEKDALNNAIDIIKSLGIEQLNPSKDLNNTKIENDYLYTKAFVLQKIDITEDAFDEEGDFHYWVIEEPAENTIAEIEEKLSQTNWTKTEADWLLIPNSSWECNAVVTYKWDEKHVPTIRVTHYPATWGYSGGSPEEWDVDIDPEEVKIFYYINLRKKID